MIEHKRIENIFNWVPMDKRKDKLGLPLPPRKPELRKPLFWLNRDDNELYFINDSEETLDNVSTTTYGHTCDLDMVLFLEGDGCLSYDHVKPQEAVKIEEFHPMWDSDFVLQVEIRLQSKKQGCFKITPPSKRGGIGEIVLLWDTGEEGNYVSIRKCKPI